MKHEMCKSVRHIGTVEDSFVYNSNDKAETRTKNMSFKTGMKSSSPEISGISLQKRLTQRSLPTDDPSQIRRELQKRDQKTDLNSNVHFLIAYRQRQRAAYNPVQRAAYNPVQRQLSI